MFCFGSAEISLGAFKYMSNGRQVDVALGERSYKIQVESGIMARAVSWLSPWVTGKKVQLITDSNVAPLYGDTVSGELTSSGADVALSVIPAGEEHKRLDTCAGLYADMVRHGLSRSSFAVALGGGVTGDMTGFVAATYMRGIPFIQIPSTLLAMVDSSVGGKTGVDLPEGKNLVGAFWQPSLVLIDPCMLRSLPLREIRCGLAEIVKYAVILDAELFTLLESNVERLLQPDIDFYTDIIARCCELKAYVVANDETEQGLRAILNYGHTFGHAVEAVSQFSVGHGEAVAIGMAMAADLAVALGLFRQEAADRQERLLQALGLPVRAPAGLGVAPIMAAMSNDKKKSSKGLVFILPQSIGKADICRGIDIPSVEAAVRGRCD